MHTRRLSLLSLLLAAIFIAACDREEPSIPTPPVNNPLPVRINEVYSRGDATTPDWVEMYNPNSTPVDVSGYLLFDNGGLSGSKPKRAIPAGTILPAMGFLAVTVDDADPSGFGISSGGETIWLENSTGSLIDSAVVPALGVDTSYARVPDGAATWRTLSPATRGATNVGGGSTVVPVVLNEAYSRGIATDPDWVEIYNPNNTAVTLTGYKIYDPGGNSGTKPKMEFPSGAVVPAKGFYVIVVDVTTEPYGFGLSSGGDEIWLENASGTVIDNTAIPAMSETQSWSRFPDGGTWQLVNTITRGTANRQ